MNEKEKGASWHILTSNDFKCTKIKDIERKEKEESLDFQDNQENGDYIWEDM